jgi:hypothetical protein
MAASDPVIERIAAYPWPHDGVQARRLHGLGERPTEIAKQLGIGRASVTACWRGPRCAQEEAWSCQREGHSSHLRPLPLRGR